MSRRKKKNSSKPIPPTQKNSSKPISPTWKIISALGGIGSVIALLLAVIPIWQTERDRNEQAQYDATRQAYNEQYLRIIQEQATQEFVNSPNPDLHLTETALAQDYDKLQATANQYAFENPGNTPTPSGIGLDIVFAFDVSESTSEFRNEFIFTSQQVIESIIDRSFTTKFGVVVFADDAELITHSNDREIVENGLIEVNDMPPRLQKSLFGIFQGIFLSYEILSSEQQNFRYKTIMVFTDGQDTSIQNSTYNLSKFIGNQNVNLIFIVPNSRYNDNVDEFLNMWIMADFGNVDVFQLGDIDPSAIAESLTK